MQSEGGINIDKRSVVAHAQYITNIIKMRCCSFRVGVERIASWRARRKKGKLRPTLPQLWQKPNAVSTGARYLHIVYQNQAGLDEHLACLMNTHILVNIQYSSLPQACSLLQF